MFESALTIVHENFYLDICIFQSTVRLFAIYSVIDSEYHNQSENGICHRR